ncbi:MAG: hypothetical protein CMA84_04565 [Euryarchaeota archaeon]|nr:hypothetical protein [Euryarchaeota archaeon]
MIGKTMDESFIGLEGTSPFQTLDLIHSSRFENIVKALTGQCEWKQVIDGDDELKQRLETQGIENHDSRASIPWDDATLLFISGKKIGLEGQLDVGLSRERFGRFPYGNGSALDYLIEWIRPPKGRDSEFDTIFESLQQLNNRLPEHLSLGNAGLHMRGWISVEEVKQLRRNLTGRNWTPAFDEPLDGGCRDVVKHLSAHLRSAEKRTAGLLLRSHN